MSATAVQTGSLQAVFFGTTTLLFRDQSHTVMVDAFLSRPDLQAVLTKNIATDPVEWLRASHRQESATLIFCSSLIRISITSSMRH